MVTCFRLDSRAVDRISIGMKVRFLAPHPSGAKRRVNAARKGKVMSSWSSFHSDGNKRCASKSESGSKRTWLIGGTLRGKMYSQIPGLWYELEELGQGRHRELHGCDNG